MEKDSRTRLSDFVGWSKALSRREKIAARYEKKVRWRRIREELEYLKKSGVEAVFENAAVELRRQWTDTHVVVREPRDNEAVSLFLRWDYEKSTSGDERWSCKQVGCRVIRDSTAGEVLGVEFDAVKLDDDYRRSVLATDKKGISEVLVRAVMSAETVRIGNDEAPIMVFGRAL